LAIFGPDLTTLRGEADRVKHALTGIDGLDDLHVELVANVPEIKVTGDIAAARRYGLKPGDVRRAAAVLVSSEEVGDIFRGGRAYDIHVWSTPETRESLTDIRNLPIDTPSGDRVRLADVATIRVQPTPNVIHREDTSRRIDIGANVSGRSLSDIVADVRNRLDGLKFGTGYHAELLGEAVEQERAQNRLLIFAIAAGIGILLLLHAAFRDMRLALLFFLTLPMALVGGVLTVYLTGGTLSLGSYVGFLAVFGIAARNGILLINHCQHLERHEGEAFGPALVVRGAKTALADHDDGTRHRACARSAGGRRHHPRSRDRAPNGAGHRGRPRHLDVRQSLHRARPVSAFREAWSVSGVELSGPRRRPLGLPDLDARRVTQVSPLGAPGRRGPCEHSRGRPTGRGRADR
jgi:Cu/Ag efflux pump CusA